MNNTSEYFTYENTLSGPSYSRRWLKCSGPHLNSRLIKRTEHMLQIQTVLQTTTQGFSQLQYDVQFSSSVYYSLLTIKHIN